MRREGFEFDLKTQRFLKNRWETDLGKKVYGEVIDGVKNGVEVRAILDRYVLDHPDNQDPYGHPHYPKSAMDEEPFWVLTQDDLRGIRVYNEDFPNNSSWSVKSLNYARFYNCAFDGANLERTSLTNAIFEKCDLENACFAGGGGYGARFINSNLKNVCFWETALIEADFSGSELEGAYFEGATVTDISVNYLTRFDRDLCDSWSSRKMPEMEMPEVLRSIRIAYEKSEIWHVADQYFFLERRKNRKAILWPQLIADKKASTYWNWLKDWLWGVSTGYGVKPVRLLAVGLSVSLVFSFIYYFAGNPGHDPDFVTSLYYSLTTFATLGYGDLHYTEARWVMRLISTMEALSGAALIAAFIAVTARKVIRR